MKLVAAFHHFPPFPGAGAIRARTISDALAEALPGKGDFAVLTTLVQGADTADLGYRVESLGDDPGDNRDRLYQRVIGEIRLGLIAGRRILAMRPGAAVVSTPGYLFAATTCAFLWFARIPYVLDVRDLYPEVYAGAGLLKRRSVIYRLFEALTKAMYRRASGIVGATAGLARHIGTVANRDDVEISYNGFPAALRAVRTPKRERFTVCFHGVMGFYQDIETLMLCARALEAHDVDVLVVGYGRKEGLFTRNPPSNLLFMGRLPFPDTIDAISACHVGLCLRTDEPISRDALPVKLFEYLGLGMPVVVTPPSEGGDLIETLGAGFVYASGDVQGIVTGILRLRDQPGLLETQHQACAKLGDRFAREAQAAHFAETTVGVLGLAR